MEETTPQKECRFCERLINRDVKVCPYCHKNQEVGEGAGRTAVKLLGMEVMKQSLTLEEQKFFKTLFSRFVRRYGLFEIEDRIALERILKNYIKILRAEKEMKADGILVTYVDSKGNEKQRIHPATFCINQWEGKLLDWLKAMSLTRAKRKITGELRKDFANWIGSHSPRVEIDEDEEKEGIGTDTEILESDAESNI